MMNGKVFNIHKNRGVKINYLNLLKHIPSHLKTSVGCYSFNRFGGVSPFPFNELNVGENVGDNPENVKINIQIIKEFTGVKKLFSVKQVHGTNFVHISSKDKESEINKVEADGIFTRINGAGLMIKHADCQAVVMFDPVRKVIANIHCGWRGAAKNILKKAVKEFESIYSSKPEDLYVGISPCLGPCCAEFKEWQQKLPAWMHEFKLDNDYFDFWKSSIYQLKKSGIKETKIFCSKRCTVCDSNYFSYRREVTTGRLATLIVLKDQ